MPQDLRLRVGAEVAQITLGGTPQQVADALRRFATAMGIPIVGVPVTDMTAVLEYVRDEIKRRAKQVQAQELRTAYEATVQSTVETDNPL